jgi:hypothetical protein
MYGLEKSVTQKARRREVKLNCPKCLHEKHAIIPRGCVRRIKKLGSVK